MFDFSTAFHLMQSFMSVKNASNQDVVVLQCFCHTQGNPKNTRNQYGSSVDSLFRGIDDSIRYKNLQILL